MMAEGNGFEPANRRLVNRGVQGGPAAALWLRIQAPNLPGLATQDWTLSLQETRVREVRTYFLKGSTGVCESWSSGLDFAIP